MGDRLSRISLLFACQSTAVEISRLTCMKVVRSGVRRKL